MSENYPQPRWGILYLVLPLAGVLFWLIQRARPSGAARSVLEIGVLLIVGAFAEAWRLANAAALLHHPLTDDERQPIYYAREVAGLAREGPGRGIRAVFVADSYNELFSAPGQVGDPLTTELEASWVEESR